MFGQIFNKNTFESAVAPPCGVPPSNNEPETHFIVKLKQFELKSLNVNQSLIMITEEPSETCF